ncbi:hypothetical protein [Methanosarcina acetivorans]|uniref:Uncharacterized protein n=1 Tax=Methanosarcina acetivorans (strain ATCC 35395 / DSM 2834 / JCM 12185 / C2A) TaxID=188937 RepID=Q8TPL4_METAC|nr:hypothetical protein [Methanosarcina acetivorans]AAM05299.1 predicted protein [Methanosarcina acetivorans C2A]
MENLVKILAPLLTILACSLGLYEKYGAKFTFEALLVIIFVLLIIFKLSKDTKTEAKDEIPSSDHKESIKQIASIKSVLSIVKIKDIKQNVETNTKKENKEGTK